MPYDLVIRNGRVIDPQTNFDTICDAAVAGGRIDATGLEARSLHDGQTRAGLIGIGIARVLRDGL